MKQKDQVAWRWFEFDQLDKYELYAILKLRQQVFIVEQNCPYLDCDDRDQTAHHLLAWRIGDSPRHPIAYLRMLPPHTQNIQNNLPALGRLLTDKNFRGKNLARSIMHEGIRYTAKLFPQSRVKISAQHYLVEFYQSLGFVTVSSPYDEDGIIHIEMIIPEASIPESQV